jgi:hypothetical protein
MLRLAATKSLVQPPLPSAIYASFDKLACWLRNPLRPRDHARLRPHCGWLRYWDETAAFNPELLQRVQIGQPAVAALELLAERNDVHANYLELALDWVFPTEWQCAEAGDFLDLHAVKNFHRQQGIRYVGRTRYTGPRSAANVLVVYDDRECKLTGEPCCHIEWRLRSRAALRQAGLASIRDMIALDHSEFWRQRLLLLEIDDLTLLGRRHNNYFHGTRRRRDWIETCDAMSWNHDARLGRIIYTICDRSVQQLIDRFAAKFDVRSACSRLALDGLLPRVTLL